MSDVRFLFLYLGAPILCKYVLHNCSLIVHYSIQPAVAFITPQSQLLSLKANGNFDNEIGCKQGYSTKIFNYHVIMNAHYKSCHDTEQLQSLQSCTFTRWIFCLLLFIFIEPIVRELIQHYLNVTCERVYICNTGNCPLVKIQMFAKITSCT